MIDEDDRKIFVGKNRFYLGKDDTIYVTLKEEINKEAILRIRGAFFKLLMTANDKCNILVLNKKTGKSSFNEKKILREVSECENFRKVAILDLVSRPNRFSWFNTRHIKDKDLEFFNTREEALKWLQE